MSEEVKVYYLTRGNDHGLNELTHICLFDYYEKNNPLLLVEKTHFDTLKKENEVLKKRLEKAIEALQKIKSGEIRYYEQWNGDEKIPDQFEYVENVLNVITLKN